MNKSSHHSPKSDSKCTPASSAHSLSAAHLRTRASDQKRDDGKFPLASERRRHGFRGGSLLSSGVHASAGALVKRCVFRTGFSPFPFSSGACVQLPGERGVRVSPRGDRCGRAGNVTDDTRARSCGLITTQSGPRRFPGPAAVCAPPQQASGGDTALQCRTKHTG